MNFSALRHRNFRLFFFGQGVSLVGTWMQRIAVSWLVYRLTHSELLLGVVGFAGQIPVLFFSSIAGVFADRWNRHRMIVITQVLCMAQALFLAALVLTGTIQVWHLVVLSVFLGIVNAFDMPIRQAFTIEMVNGREDLGNAIALNSSLFNLTRLVGPAVAGLLISVVGEGVCFLVNGISYVAVLVSLLIMRLPRRVLPDSRPDVLRELREGVVFCFRHRRIRTILMMLVVLSFMGMPYTVLMPVFAADVLHGDSQTLGFLMTASGCGALVGALSLTSKWNLNQLRRIFVLSLAVFGATLAGFGISKNLWLSMALMVFTGWGATSFLAAGNTMLQTIVPDEMRGRLMSLFTIALLGTFPVGSLIAGAAADHIGAPVTVAAGGAVCLAGAFYVAARLRSVETAEAGAGSVALVETDRIIPPDQPVL